MSRQNRVDLGLRVLLLPGSSNHNVQDNREALDLKGHPHRGGCKTPWPDTGQIPHYSAGKRIGYPGFQLAAENSQLHHHGDRV